MIKNYLITFVIYFAIEILWLTVLARSIYERYIGDLLAANPNLLVSLVYFVIVIAGLVFFAVYPALEKNSIGYAIFAGSLFGLMSYATYTVVNYATLRGWPLEVVFVDLAWGTFINGATAGIAYYVINLFAK